MIFRANDISTPAAVLQFMKKEILNSFDTPKTKDAYSAFWFVAELLFDLMSEQAKTRKSDTEYFLMSNG